MIEFWLYAGLLLALALAFLLIPLIRARKVQSEEDRTALNVTLYQERIAELQAQHEAGMLDADQLEAGRAEAGRELLADTDGQIQRQTELGRKIPLIVALLVPLLGYGLYTHWGAIDKVQQASEMAAQQPQSVGEIIAQLETTLAANPDSAEGWYFLGRAYMAEGRAADAAKAFERSVELANRPAELLGMLAQAQYFAAGRQWSEALQALADEAMAKNPDEMTTLGLLGIVAFEEQRFANAIGYWQRLADQLPADDPSRQSIEGGIANARARLAEQGEAQAQSIVEVQVSLAPALLDKVEPSDTVFVFARLPDGPPMPLAARRMTVADLPATVTLSDADSLLPQLKLSSQRRVQLAARVSREGNGMKGEWIGVMEPIELPADQVQQLRIDRADSP